MPAVGDLDQVLTQAADRIAAVRHFLTATQEALNEAGEHLALALDSTADPDVLAAFAGFEPTQETLIEACQTLSLVMVTIMNCRRSLAVEHAVDSSSTSVPHPSTHKAHRLAGPATKPQWARERLAELPKREPGDQTHGTFVDTDGNQTRLASGTDQESHTAALTLLNSKRFPQIPNPNASPAAAGHVETKAAQRMRDSGQTYGVLVVNNTMCTGPLGCETAVRAILPKGSTLVVWEPDRDRPTMITGEARP